ncbi:halocyanin domain-containing protein, partial [Halobacteriales archaeon QS_1_68_17]
NVIGEDNDLDSGEPVASSGVNYEYTFEEDGIYKYVCEPHLSLGMKGAVVVGTDYPATGGGGGGGGGGEGGGDVDPEEMGVPIQPHFVGIGAVLMMLVSLVFTFFQLKYGESPNTKGGNT